MDSLTAPFKFHNTSIMIMRKLLLLLPAAIALASPVSAVQINWGCEVDSVLRDSFGNPLDGTFAIQLGYFESVLGVAFVPDATNIADWSSRWKVFDQAAFDPSSGYFTSSALLMADGSSTGSFASSGPGMDFSNQDAYIWIFDSKIAAPGSEWFLGRSATAGGWRLPAKPADDCCDTAVLEWSVTDLTTNDTPVFGRQGVPQGAGEKTVTSPSYTLQTFSVVPEPSSCLLLTLGGVMAAFRRRRPES